MQCQVFIKSVTSSITSFTLAPQRFQVIYGFLINGWACMFQLSTDLIFIPNIKKTLTPQSIIKMWVILSQGKLLQCTLVFRSTTAKDAYLTKCTPVNTYGETAKSQPTACVCAHVHILPRRMKIQVESNDQGDRVKRSQAWNLFTNQFRVQTGNCSGVLQTHMQLCPALLFAKELTAGHKRTSFTPPSESLPALLN